MHRPLLLLALLVSSCEGGHALSSPIVRIDLRAKLPEPVVRRLAIDDTSYECRKPIALEVSGARQRFVATYRVFDDVQGKFITAVQLEPDGPTEGAHTPEASGAVLNLENRGRATRVVAVVPLRVSWGATKGCSKLASSIVVMLPADAPDCKPPAPKVKLLSPVK
jgi:hypothetical protein